MITLPNNVEVNYFAGAGAMSGTIGATALSDGSIALDRRAVVVTSSSHGVKANTDLFVSDIDTGTAYLSNRMRRIFAVGADTLTLALAREEAYAAGTPAGTESWCAGYISKYPYFLLGFKIHLSAADSNGETLTLTTDSGQNSSVTYWDTLLYSKVMTGVTDIVWFPEVRIPLMGNDAIKFAWTNTGAKTWGIELFTQARV